MRTTIQLGMITATVLLITAVALGVPQQGQLSITDGPRIEDVSARSAEIAWTTSTGGSSVIRYGTDPNNLNQTAQSAYSPARGPGEHATHRVKIANLQPNTTYYFVVDSGQGQNMGGEAKSALGQFMTSGSGSSDKVPLYRAFSQSANRHLFTPSYQELRSAESNYGYQDEGVAGYVQRKQTDGTEPLYRIFVSAGNDHFYTANAAERTKVLSGGGTRDEGIVGYIATSQVPGTTPLFRLQAQGQHFYTADANERQRLLRQGVWNDEGIVGYVWQH